LRYADLLRLWLATATTQNLAPAELDKRYLQHGMHVLCVQMRMSRMAISALLHGSDRHAMMAVQQQSVLHSHIVQRRSEVQ
jgi:hypothetical protein